MLYGKHRNHFIGLDETSWSALPVFFQGVDAIRPYIDQLIEGQELNELYHCLEVSGRAPRAFQVSNEKSFKTWDQIEQAAEMLGVDLKGEINPRYSSRIPALDELEMLVLGRAHQGTRCFVVRWSIDGTAQRLAELLDEEASGCSVICAGEQSHMPLQTLTDLYTLWLETNHFHDPISTLVISGSIWSPPVRDLLIGVARFKLAKIVTLVSVEPHPPEVGLLVPAGVEVQKASDLASIAAQGKVFYMVQSKPFRYEDDGAPPADREVKRLSELCGINDDVLQDANPNAIFMHPLPWGLEYHGKVPRSDRRFVHWAMLRHGLATKVLLFLLILAPGSSFIPEQLK